MNQIELQPPKPIYRSECFIATDLRFVIRTKQRSTGSGIIFSEIFLLSIFCYIKVCKKTYRIFLISVLNRIERNEMDHLKAVREKKNYRTIIAREYIAALESGLRRVGGPNARLGKVFMTPQTFAGSRQYYQQKYANLMTIVRRLGNPTWFLNCLFYIM